MRIRAVAAATLMAAASVALVGAPSSTRPASAEPIRLDVAPGSAVAPVTVRLDGACPGESDPDGMIYPTSALLGLEDTDVPERQVGLDDDGTFTAAEFEVPADLAAQEYQFVLTCSLFEKVTVSREPFSVLAAPTLAVDPLEGRAGSTLAVSGTCPRDAGVGPSTGPEVRFDGVPLGTATLDGTTGVFSSDALTVPADAEAVAHQVTTSCGGEQMFLVLAEPTPTGTPTPTPTSTPTPSPSPTVTPSPTPTPAHVVVPDLSRRTLDQARADLDAVGLVLADPGVEEGTVVGQEPAPGQLVPPGTAVSVELASDPVIAADPRPAVPLTVVLLALLGIGATTGAVMAERGRRRHTRERRWVEEQVGTAVEFRGARPRPVPDTPVPALDVRFEVRPGATRLYVQEAVHARD